MNVVQREMSRSSATVRCFNAARSIVCGATYASHDTLNRVEVQCRTQHCMWCNIYAEQTIDAAKTFQCRTQHCMWCNSDKQV